MRHRAPDDPGTPPTPIAEAIDRYVAHAGFKRRLVQASVIPEWAELVGPSIAEVTRPLVVLDNGVLVVAVQTSAWMQELQMHSPEILQQLGKRGKKIRRIVWRDEGQTPPESG